MGLGVPIPGLRFALARDDEQGLATGGLMAARSCIVVQGGALTLAFAPGCCLVGVPAAKTCRTKGMRRETP